MKRSRIRQVSKKRAAEIPKRREFVRTFLAEHPDCQANLQNCTRRAVDVHERLNRSQGGTILGDDPNGYLALCRRCHTKITDLEVDAYALGLSVHPWEAESRAQDNGDTDIS